MKRGQVGMLGQVFAAGLVGAIFAVIIAVVWAQSRGNFSGLGLSIGDFLVPLFMLAVVVVPIAAVVMLLGGGRKG